MNGTQRASKDNSVLVISRAVVEASGSLTFEELS